MEPVGDLDVDPPPWSRDDSVFLRNYPWDATVLLAGPAHSLEKHFQVQEGNGDTVDRVLRSNVVLHRRGHGAVGGEAQTIEHFLQPLIGKLLDYEALDVLSPHGQAHERMIQQLILSKAANTDFMDSPESTAILRRHRITKGTQASNLLCRYVALLRVIDVASALEGGQRSARISKWHHWEPAENPALSHLSDIQSLALKAKHALKTLVAPSDDAERAEESLNTKSLDTPHRIMKELAHFMGKAKGCQIVNNILLASLHLSWLLSGNIDIPNTFSEAVHSAAPTVADEAEISPETFSQGAVDLATLTEAERAELSNLLSEKDSPSGIRFPLTYSLFISPLFLLRTCCTWKRSMDRLHLLTAAIHMGNDRPPVIATAERVIFSVLFGIAKGTMTAHSGVQYLMHSMPWESIASLPQEVSAWFVLPANAPLAPSPSGSQPWPSLSPPHTRQEASASGSSPMPTAFANRDLALPHSLGPSPLSERSSVGGVPPVELLHEFATRIQSAMISTSIGSALPQSVVATVALVALGLNLDESTVRQLVSGLVPSGNATIMPAPPNGSGHYPSQASVFEGTDESSGPLSSLTSSNPSDPTVLRTVLEESAGNLLALSGPPAPLGLGDPGQAFVHGGSSPRPSTPIIPDIDLQNTPTSSTSSSPLSSPPSSPTIANVDLDDIATAAAALLKPLDPQSMADGNDKGEDVNTGSEKASKPKEADSDTPSKPAGKPRPKRSRAPSRHELSPESMDEETSDSRPSKRAKVGSELPPFDISTDPVNLKTASLSSSGNSLDTAIVVDRIMDATRTMGPPEKTKFLNHDQDPKKPKRHPPKMPEQGYTFYGPCGKAFTWKPRFYGMDVTLFEDWVSAIKPNVRSGKPLHVSDPDKSLFLVMDEADYNALTVEQRRDVWAKQGKLAIIQTNCQQSQALKFDNAGMATLTGRIDVQIEVQGMRIHLLDISYPEEVCLETIDQSQPLGTFGNISRARSRRTTLEELVELSDIPIEKRPIVNALNLPLTPGLRPEQNFPFSSEHVVWLRTLGNSLCFNDYPTSHTRWSLVAFDGALHYAHIDSDGFGTWVEVKHGLKLWVIARPKKGTDKEPIPSFGDINGVLRAFGVGDKPSSNWDVEAVVLAPGSRLIMAPNTMHAVWTMQNSICYGGHFYSVVTLLPTVIGVIHAFIGEARLTNTDHFPSRLLLRRMVHFFHYTFVCRGGSTAESADKEHLPNFEDSGMFASTFALLFLMELQNVLDFRSYILPNDDISSVWYRISAGSMALCNVNAIPHEERLECIYTRGLALELATWVFCHYNILPQTGPHANQPLLDLWVDFYWPNLAHFMVAIDVYKARYPHGITKERKVSIEAFRLQVKYSVDSREELESACNAIDRFNIKSIAPPFAYSIVKREKPHAFLPDTPEELTANGYRGGDRVYIEAYKEALACQAHRRRAEQSHR